MLENDVVLIKHCSLARLFQQLIEQIKKRIWHTFDFWKKKISRFFHCYPRVMHNRVVVLSGNSMKLNGYDGCN